MRLLALTLVATAATLLTGATPLSAAPFPAGNSVLAMSDGITPVAEGCGPGRWRGPWGGCRGPGYGPGPGYSFGPHPAWNWNGCPPGYWRGPWGHCRDTPYHGRMPGGGWK
jgi:hypothetical protein